MADNLKLKVDKQKKRVEIELGDERLALSFEFLQQLAMTVMSDKSPVFEKEIPLK
ncbi:hypothetical protein P162_0051 [Bacteriophage T5-like cott162]|uniref:Uncharacterized protein n=14 Tax=Caudoviricetes TaxID=2731619 RepID=A0A6G8RJU0_9CAUD|nr:hypothetical protein HOS37_gp163 [Escherichia phage saus132]YP_009805675.1 hypothetical protein HOT64_gp128 [Salmonella phage S132]YP_009816715.1 hypothetical protein HOU65_gp171 [Salmonella phage Seafire]YP_009858831.1 hypothetical protein HWD27_gp144 [Salmonella phage oselot]ASU02415.1 hypothetical protein P1301_0052 [Bacteriophage T5-like chee130_1]ASU02721.1 hypothetical protein P149_0050 [Bacteriophage T5-like poul149]ASU02876.1 hypothetical protein P158_0052 [Bacteriophage T5-like ch